MSTQLTKVEQIETSLMAPDFQKMFNATNPFNLSVAREIAFIMQLCRKSDYLAGCELESFKEAALNCSLTGLTLNPILNQAYLIPRKVNGKLVACLDPGYQGLISKLIDCEAAVDIYAHVVFEWEVENGKFELSLGTKKEIKHLPYYMFGVSEKDAGKPIGVYAVAVLPDGSKKPEFVPAERVNSIMIRTESYKAAKNKGTTASIWMGEDKYEMWKKTAVKYLWKFLSKNEKMEKLAEAMELSNHAHELTDTDYSENNTQFKPANKDAANAMNQNASKKATDVKSKATTSKIEDAVVVEVSNESLDELMMIIDNDYPLPAAGKPRNINAFNQIKTAIEERGFNLAKVDEELKQGNSSYSDHRELFQKANATIICKVLELTI